MRRGIWRGRENAPQTSVVIQFVATPRETVVKGGRIVGFGRCGEREAAELSSGYSSISP